MRPVVVDYFCVRWDARRREAPMRLRALRTTCAEARSPAAPCAARNTGLSAHGCCTYCASSPACIGDAKQLFLAHDGTLRLKVESALLDGTQSHAHIFMLLVLMNAT